MWRKTSKRWCHVSCGTLSVGNKKLCLNLLQLNSLMVFVVSLIILYSAVCSADCSPRSGVRHTYGECERKGRLAASRFEGIVRAFRMFTTAVYKLVCTELRFKEFPLYYVFLLHIRTGDKFSQCYFLMFQLVFGAFCWNHVHWKDAGYHWRVHRSKYFGKRGGVLGNEVRFACRNDTFLYYILMKSVT